MIVRWRASCALLHVRSFSSVRRLVLGIESSCDDSCAAVVSDQGDVLSSFQQSQEKQNQENRGVIPSVAAKTHRAALPVVAGLALEKCPSIDAVALTIGPGIAPCLGEGLSFAKSLCKQYRVPLILVNHMEGHAMAATMKVGNAIVMSHRTTFPFQQSPSWYLEETRRHCSAETRTIPFTSWETRWMMPVESVWTRCSATCMKTPLCFRREAL